MSNLLLSLPNYKTPLLLDAYMDVGSRAMQEQLPRGLGWEIKIKYLNSPHPSLLPQGEGTNSVNLRRYLTI